jgi:hypothetical protein
VTEFRRLVSVRFYESACQKAAVGSRGKSKMMRLRQVTAGRGERGR